MCMFVQKNVKTVFSGLQSLSYMGPIISDLAFTEINVIKFWKLFDCACRVRSYTPGSNL